MNNYNYEDIIITNNKIEVYCLDCDGTWTLNKVSYLSNHNVSGEWHFNSQELNIKSIDNQWYLHSCPGCSDKEWYIKH